MQAWLEVCFIDRPALGVLKQMIVGGGYIGCRVLNIQWVGLMPGTPSLGPGATISLPGIASHIGGHYCSASTTTTSLLTGWTEKSSMIASPILWRWASFEFTFQSGAGFEAPFSQSASCKWSISRKATQRIFCSYLKCYFDYDNLIRSSMCRAI